MLDLAWCVFVVSTVSAVCVVCGAVAYLFVWSLLEWLLRVTVKSGGISDAICDNAFAWGVNQGLAVETLGGYLDRLTALWALKAFESAGNAENVRSAGNAEKGRNREEGTSAEKGRNREEGRSAESAGNARNAGKTQHKGSAQKAGSAGELPEWLDRRLEGTFRYDIRSFDYSDDDWSLWRILSSRLLMMVPAMGVAGASLVVVWATMNLKYTWPVTLPAWSLTLLWYGPHQIWETKYNWRTWPLWNSLSPLLNFRVVHSCAKRRPDGTFAVTPDVGPEPGSSKPLKQGPEVAAPLAAVPADVSLARLPPTWVTRWRRPPWQRGPGSADVAACGCFAGVDKLVQITYPHGTLPCDLAWNSMWMQQTPEQVGRDGHWQGRCASLDMFFRIPIFASICTSSGVLSCTKTHITAYFADTATTPKSNKDGAPRATSQMAAEMQREARQTQVREDPKATEVTSAKAGPIAPPKGVETRETPLRASETGSGPRDIRRTLVITPGGAAEATLTDYGDYRIIFNLRNGIFRLAGEKGLWVVPTLSLGENTQFLVGPKNADISSQDAERAYWRAIYHYARARRPHTHYAYVQSRKCQSRWKRALGLTLGTMVTLVHLVAILLELATYASRPVNQLTALAFRTSSPVTKKFIGFSSPWFCGNGLFGWMPTRFPTFMVVGSPIRYVGNDDETVQKAKADILAQIKALFTEHAPLITSRPDQFKLIVAA